MSLLCVTLKHLLEAMFRVNDSTSVIPKTSTDSLSAIVQLQLHLFVLASLELCPACLIELKLTSCWSMPETVGAC